jgi:hypothetical protein
VRRSRLSQPKIGLPQVEPELEEFLVDLNDEERLHWTELAGKYQYDAGLGEMEADWKALWEVLRCRK